VPVRLAVHVQPRAKRDEIVGWHGERLKIRLTAPPVEGAANEALVNFIAKALGLRRSQVTITHGLTSREKTVAIDGVTAGDLAERIASLLDLRPEG
jgi:uncharacterized protein (TIGR00251 family)